MSLIAAGQDATWSGMLEDVVIGHVHLQVGDTEEAERFYRNELGMDVTCRYRRASFFVSGGYHQQLAANAWNSADAGPRTSDTTGLVSVEVVPDRSSTVAKLLSRATYRDENGKVVLDQWRTEFVLR